MRNYPSMAAARNLVEPSPRRVRGFVGGRPVFDTTSASYCWEVAYYPQYYIPLDDVDERLLIDEKQTERRPQGLAHSYGLGVDDLIRPGAVRIFHDDAVSGLAGTARFEWSALDAWFEEEEQVFVHPRNPYVRVDALRSSRAVRIELDGQVLAEAPSAVMVFETGLPTRYYLDRTMLRTALLRPSDTRSECPYKGTTSAYWSAMVDGRLTEDIAWTYDFPTRQLQPITGLVAFYNEKVDLFLDDVPLERPSTHLA